MSGRRLGAKAMPAEAARRVKLVVLDADGVFTDGGIYVVETRADEVRDLRRFHVQDGLGIHLLRRAGIRIAVVSGKKSASVRARALELGVDEVHQVHPFNKLRAVEDILTREGVAWHEVACLGDDLADLPLLERTGLPCSVVNAVPEVQGAAAWTSSVRGGEGAIREFVQALLQARGVWESVVAEYLEACRQGIGEAAELGEIGSRGG